MLEDARQNILDTIDKKTKEIRKYRNQIKILTEKEKAEENDLKKWMLQIRLRHQENAILSRKEDLKDLALNLEITDEAIASQKRDTEIIEANEHLPMPNDLTAQLASYNMDTPDAEADKEHPFSFSGFMEPLLTLGNSLFHMQKKIEASSSSTPENTSKKPSVSETHTNA